VHLPFYNIATIRCVFISKLYFDVFIFIIIIIILFSSDVDGLMFLKVMFNTFFKKSVVSFSKYLFIMLYT